MFVDCAENPNSEIATPQTRIRRLFREIKTGKLDYMIVPAYHPDRRIRSAVKVELANGPLPQFMLFAPELRDLYKTLSAEQFRYEVLVTFAHEVIHLEQLDEYKLDTLNKIATEEAAAWGKTIFEIIRPLLADGKSLPARHAKLSDLLRRFNDDYRSSEWIKMFMLN